MNKIKHFSGFAAIAMALTVVAGGATVELPTRQGAAIAQSMPEITTTSTRDTIALAKHLSRINAKVYVAYWCPYCHRQLNRFGKQAVNYLNVIECDRGAVNNQHRLCVAKGISSFPTWEINGRLYKGMRGLGDLAEIANYQ